MVERAGTSQAGWSVGQVAWRLGVSIRGYRELEAGERWPNWETWDRDRSGHRVGPAPDLLEREGHGPSKRLRFWSPSPEHARYDAGERSQHRGRNRGEERTRSGSMSVRPSDEHRQADGQNRREGPRQVSVTAANPIHMERHLASPRSLPIAQRNTSVPTPPQNQVVNAATGRCSCSEPETRSGANTLISSTASHMPPRPMAVHVIQEPSAVPPLWLGPRSPLPGVLMVRA